MKLAKKISVIIFICSALLFVFCIVTNQSKIDRNGPEIVMDQGEIQASIHDGDDVLLNGITATDSKDGDVTDSLVVEGVSNFIESGRRKYTVVAFDSDNNITRVTRELIYTDYEAPRFELSGPLRFAFGDANYTEYISASDCIDGDISSKIRIAFVEAIEEGVAGGYKLIYTVSNSGGDAIQLPVTVEFYNKEEANGPTIELSEYLIYIGVGDSVNPKNYIENVYGNGVASDKIAIENQINSATPGVYEVIYRVTDKEGMSGVARLFVVVEE